MSKVICDVCGTSFAETSERCPICGCAKHPAAKTVTFDDAPMNHEGSTANMYARGGRFSKTNVKRTPNTHTSKGRFYDESGCKNVQQSQRPVSRPRRNEPQENNKGLIAVVIILLLAIVMVVAYLAINVLFPDFNVSSNQDKQTTGAHQAPGPDINQTIYCTDLKLKSPAVFVLESENSQYLLEIEKVPENATETPTYASSDPTVVTVDQKGNVVPVGYGEAVITITCGSASVQCTVMSTVGEPPVASNPAPSAPALPNGFVLTLETWKGSGEITISKEGGSHQLYKETMGVKASDIVWTTDDPSVAVVENGKVIGVDRGKCYITATIGDQIATCLVRCAFDAAAPAPYVLSNTDVTLGFGKTFNLSLKDKSTGANVQGVEWTADIEGVVEIDGNNIIGKLVSTNTIVKVSTEKDGVTYTCIVRVTAPQ